VIRSRLLGHSYSDIVSVLEEGGSNLEQTPPQGDRDRVRPVIRLQFVNDIFDVKVDGGLRDTQLIGDLLVLVSFADQFKDFQLARRQILLPHVLCQTTAYVGWDMLTTHRHGPDDP
jgi:hypothetical protein